MSELTTLILLFTGVLLGSFFCSLSEAAILSLSFTRAKILCEQGRKHAKDLVYLKEHMDRTLATIVILNNAVNIVGAIFIGQHAAMAFGSQWLGLVSALTTLSIIIIAEIIPKTIGERYKTTVSLLIAKPIRWLVVFMQPIVRFTTVVVRPFLKKGNLPKITEEEIKIMLRLGRDEGTVEHDEEVLCNRVFRLNDLRAFQMMKPITQILSLPAQATLQDLRETIIASRFSRIAVHDKSCDDIVGIVQQRSLLREIAQDHQTSTVRDFMTEPIFISQHARADTLLEKFQTYHQHLFIVQDDQGKNIGLITMEDVLEELFGEIYDEQDI